MREINRHGVFDIVVINGIERVQCVRPALRGLKPDGVVIWDNSDREEFIEGYRVFAEHGFRELNFKGMGPINTYSWQTSILYRANNCLGI